MLKKEIYSLNEEIKNLKNNKDDLKNEIISLKANMQFIEKDKLRHLEQNEQVFIFV